MDEEEEMRMKNREIFEIRREVGSSSRRGQDETHVVDSESQSGTNIGT